MKKRVPILPDFPCKFTIGNSYISKLQNLQNSNPLPRRFSQQQNKLTLKDHCVIIFGYSLRDLLGHLSLISRSSPATPDEVCLLFLQDEDVVGVEARCPHVHLKRTKQNDYYIYSLLPLTDETLCWNFLQWGGGKVMASHSVRQWLCTGVPRCLTKHVA